MSKFIKTLEELENLKLRHYTIMADRLVHMKKVESLEKILNDIREKVRNYLECDEGTPDAVLRHIDQLFEEGKDNDR